MTTRIINAAELSPGIPLTVLQEHKDESHDPMLAAMRPCPWIGAPLKARITARPTTGCTRASMI